MLIYEVTATVEPSLVVEFERYMLERHIADVIASGCFKGATLLKVRDGKYRSLYRIADDATLQRYLDEHAPGLRADFARHFPRGVELGREVWREMHEWNAPATGRD